MQVLTLVRRGLDASSLPTEIADFLRSEGLTDDPPARRELSPDHALDLLFDGPALDEARAAEVRARLSELCAGRGADMALQDAAGRRKKLLVADMESTVIRNEMLDELADFVGLREQIAAITERAMNGELDFETAIKERVSLLKGLDESVLSTCAERMELDPGARVLVRTLQAHGVPTALVSGGFTFFARRVQEDLGFDFMQANELLVENGKLTGEVGLPILDREAKVTALDRLCAEHGLSAADAVTVGDGANDLSMLLKSGLGVAFHGKKHVAEAARFRIDHGDLSTLLYFQGYADDQWQR